MNRYDFTGRTALVTGGASGIGAATAKRLADGGARVAVFDREPANGFFSVTGDVSSSADVDSAVAQVEAEIGPLDIVVNSAGVPGESLRTVDVSDEEWNRVMAINASGTFYVCRAVLRGMIERGYGRIVLVASIAGKEGNPMAGAYSASKAAVIETPILQGITQEHIDYMVERIPLGRVGRPTEVAALICFLASEDLSFSTGAIYDISGGRAVY